MNQDQLKAAVQAYWNKESCGTSVTQQSKFSKIYFDEIETYRYEIEPEIFSFAQFTRYYGKRVLEVGIGAGTDFIQWVRSGAQAYGVDLTPESIEHTRQRLMIEQLHAFDLQVADAEQLPYPDNSFDLVYSWGVIHHSPNTEQCLRELVRVVRPGGTIKIMVYNRRSLFAFYRYVLCGLLKGKPLRSFKNILFYDQESLGTKAYTMKEVRTMIKQHAVTIKSLTAPVTYHDLLGYKSRIFRGLASFAASIFGWQRVGWFMLIELKKNKD
ncbi:MAG: Demethylrebeccamycin-D-glucose O-methyltransferase [Candidatus Dependentiae bacterium ADurb.Bin331]|nr:MAG: Demethylrebeccamycin-D-glucose O-methyltransferase [Candidatus Dependentiae bacterium ADurb.Bin331]